MDHDKTKSKNVFPHSKHPVMMEVWDHADFTKTGTEEEDELGIDAEQLLASVAPGQ